VFFSLLIFYVPPSPSLGPKAHAPTEGHSWPSITTRWSHLQGRSRCQEPSGHSINKCREERGRKGGRGKHWWMKTFQEKPWDNLQRSLLVERTQLSVQVSTFLPQSHQHTARNEERTNKLKKTKKLGREEKTVRKTERGEKKETSRSLQAHGYGKPTESVPMTTTAPVQPQLIGWGAAANQKARCLRGPKMAAGRPLSDRWVSLITGLVPGGLWRQRLGSRVRGPRERLKKLIRTAEAPPVGTTAGLSPALLGAASWRVPPVG
jgi:hypothetical protein